MKPKKFGIALFLLALISIGIGSMMYTKYRLKGHQEFISDYAPVVERIEKAKGKTITLTETKNGHRKWVLKMKEIKYSKDNSIANLTDVKGLVYDEKQAIMFTFEAPAGQYFKDKSRILLNDGARMISPSAEVVIISPNMDWSSESNLITATGGVQMKKKNFGISKAEKATLSTDFSHIQFSGHATSVLGAHTNTGD